ncbi:hypothetical protein TD95_001556 [Thielaviopsis punctulata]|uniref:Peptidase A1 domain-containing protein n=1 Tax=Thielaviopsis punctulata TaxID=72032 RepID=A0A0F4ZCR4_9PEZI|nr:hypothetical protein TD95_001556 [Thielaviopsis punctulata]
MARYSMLVLGLAAPLISAWPQIFENGVDGIILTERENNQGHRIPYQVIKARDLPADSQDSPQETLPVEYDPEKRELVHSAKFRGRGLPVVSDSLSVTLPVPVTKGAVTPGDANEDKDKRTLPVVTSDPDSLFKITLPVTKGSAVSSKDADHEKRGLPVVDSDSLSITLPVGKISQIEGNLKRGLPVVAEDPEMLYKISLPMSDAVKRGLPVVTSDPESLYKITLPVARPPSKRDDEDDEALEISLPVEFAERSQLPVDTDPEDVFEVTLPVTLNSRGLPVVTSDPESLYKITLPVTKSSASTPKRALSLTGTPRLSLHLPVVHSSGSKRGLPTNTTSGDDAFTITLPVSKPSGNTKQARQHDASAPSTVTLRPPTDEENVPMKHYAQGRRSEYGRSVRRTPSGVLKMPVVKREKRGLTRRGNSEVDIALEKLQKEKRADGSAISISVANRSDVAYYAQLDFGTPPQSIYVQIDTGSFELWVNPTCDNLSSGDKIFCEAVGHYDVNSSSTVTGPDGSKSLVYGIGAANVTYYKDSISIGSSATMRQVQFGVANSTEDQFAGILGLGYGYGATISYKNFIDELASQNVTQTRTFSIGLGAKDKTDGVLVFGGVDTAKFTGPLVKLPIIPAAKSPDGVPRYWVQMENITLTPPSGQTSAMYNGSDIPAFLDSGATLTLLPPKLADAIAADFGATDGVSSNGFYSVDCAVAKANGTVDFGFNGITVHVPYAEMVRTLATSPPSCWLGFVPSTQFTLLGDTFLRSVYAVIDIDNDNAYLAEYSDCGEQLLSVSNGTNLATVTGKCAKTVAEVVLPTGTPTSSASDVPAVARTTTPVSSSTSKAKSTTTTAHSSATTSDADAKSKTTASSTSAAETAAPTGSDSNSGSDSGSGSDSDSDSGSNSGSDSDSNTGSGSDSDSNTGSDSGSDSGSGSDSSSGSGSGSSGSTGSSGGSSSGSSSDSESSPAAGAGASSGASSGSSDSSPASGTASDADSAPSSAAAAAASSSAASNATTQTAGASLVGSSRLGSLVSTMAVLAGVFSLL